MRNTNEGVLLVLSGPSGVGKTTIARRLVERRGFVKITTCTTRSKRPGEIDGKHYNFLTREKFDGRVREGGFLEHAEVHGELYGTPRDAILRELKAGNVVVLDIDVQGAESVRRSGLPAVRIFLAPPDREELLRRIRGRASETEEQIARRLRTAEREFDAMDSFERVIVNDDVDRAVGEVLDELRKKGVKG